MTVTFGDGSAYEVRLPTAGRHNASNALGVIGACFAAGFAPEVSLPVVATFPGVGRRLERKGEVAGVVVYDDYGHHPTAIRETLAAVRQREPGRRAWAVYEPLTFHRTAALLEAFAEVLAHADAVAIADIWAGRDPDTTVASAAGLAAAVARHNPSIVAEAPGSVEATAAWLAEHVVPGDVVLVMGGGRSYRIGELLLEHLECPMSLTYAEAYDLLGRLVDARSRYDGDLLVEQFADVLRGGARSLRACPGGAQCAARISE